MDGPEQLKILMAKAERVVRAQQGSGVTLHTPTLIAERDRSLVVRCTVSGWPGVGSLVLKQNRGDDARGFTDWASLQFLSSLQDAEGVAPRFYAGNPGERILIMEDLGGSRNIEGLLDGAAAEEVVSAFASLATTMGRLAAATMGQEQHFAQTRDTLPGTAGLGRQQEAARWLETRGKVTRWAEVLGVSISPGFDSACEYIAEAYTEPGDFLVFSHGDPAPSNNHLSGEHARLVDFEYAGYRHALYDLTAWDILCPLPGEWVATMEQHFRNSANIGFLTLALDGNDRYVQAKAIMCAYRALAMIGWFSPDILADNRDWAPGWSQREALISTTLRLHEKCAEFPVLEPVATLGGALAETLQTRWPELGDGSLKWPAVTGYPW